MAIVRPTSKQPLKRFSNLRVYLALACGLLFLPAGALAQSGTGSLCQAEEGVLFSCQLEGNHKLVSLCTSPKAAPFQSVSYRYGLTGKVELAYVASAENHNRFLATVSPTGPKSSVRQVWFESKDTKYIVTACVGGDCPHNGGLIVFRGAQLLMSRACTDDSTQPWFSSKVVHFTSELQNSQSRTDLIQLQDYDNNVEVLYPSKRVN
jgi:hypothetical protein